MDIFFCLVFVLPLCVPCGHLLGKSWPLSSSLWRLILSLSLLGQVWYLIVSIPDLDLCTLTYFERS